MEYLKIDNGSNTMRIFSKIEHSLIHWVNNLNGGGITSEECIGASCHWCVSGLCPRPRHMASVIDRKDEHCKLFYFGSQIFKQIEWYIQDPNWGNNDWKLLDNHDVTITRQNQGINTQNIVWVEYGIKPLTVDEQKLINDFLSGKCSVAEDTSCDPDMCSKCGTMGEIKGMACICKSCGNLIWGC